VGGSFAHIRTSKHVWAGPLIGRNTCLAPATVIGALCALSAVPGTWTCTIRLSHIPVRWKRGAGLCLKDPLPFSLSLSEMIELISEVSFLKTLNFI
jgi:hypothetical protein